MIDSRGINSYLIYLPYRMIEFSKTKVPDFVKDALEPIKGDDEEVRKYGV